MKRIFLMGLATFTVYSTEKVEDTKEPKKVIIEWNQSKLDYALEITKSILEKSVHMYCSPTQTGHGLIFSGFIKNDSVQKEYVLAKLPPTIILEQFELKADVLPMGGDDVQIEFFLVPKPPIPSIEQNIEGSQKVYPSVD